MPADFRVSITNGTGQKRLSDFQLHLAADSDEVLRRRQARCHQGLAEVVLIGDGQNFVEALSYAKLPKEVVAKELKAIGQIQ